MKKKLRFTANIAFEAEDLDEAFTLLRDHFAAILDDADTDAWFIGEMDIRPQEEEHEETTAGVVPGVEVPE